LLFTEIYDIIFKMAKTFEPAYVELYRTGELKKRIEKLYNILSSCSLCPRECGVDRTKGESGYCRSGMNLLVSSIGPHFGEEPELVGRGGSGTIFLANCNLGCIYCQNYDISHLSQGREMSEEEVAKAMLHLQSIGCHNINFVTPTHFVPQLIKSVEIACEKGLRIPVVYNCGGYESLKIIRLLDGIVDIYMPDIKYSDNACAKKYSNAPDYFEKCSEAVKEMYNQVGDLNGPRGLLVRHLVLPHDISGSQKVLGFIAEEISKNTYVNIMNQYRPCYKAADHEELNRRPTLSEYNRAINLAKGFGLHRGMANEVRHL
jgi:putative pyruvate formate lyase activating enzyme